MCVWLKSDKLIVNDMPEVSYFSWAIRKANLVQ